MSTKKFTHRASMTNRPTGGGPKKAGLAPFATNFMMGVKQNHQFDKKPVRHLQHEGHTSSDHHSDTEADGVADSGATTGADSGGDTTTDTGGDTTTDTGATY